MLKFLQGRFMRHPLHPLLVHLPVGLWITSLIFDIAYFATSSANFAVASYYCMLVGLVAVLLAAPTGYAEFLTIAKGTRPRQIALTHMVMNVGISLLYLVNVILRYRIEIGPPVLVTTGQFILSLVCVGALGISGYLGGMLVFQYGIGRRYPEAPNVSETGGETDRSRRVA